MRLSQVAVCVAEVLGHRALVFASLWLSLTAYPELIIAFYGLLSMPLVTLPHNLAVFASYMLGLTTAMFASSILHQPLGSDEAERLDVLLLPLSPGDARIQLASEPDEEPEEVGIRPRDCTPDQVRFGWDLSFAMWMAIVIFDLGYVLGNADVLWPVMGRAVVTIALYKTFQLVFPGLLAAGHLALITWRVRPACRDPEYLAFLSRPQRYVDATPCG